jgi:hypothetical protein
VKIDAVKRDDLGGTILKGTMESDHLADVGFELGEIALDQLLDEGVLREIPILRSVAGIVKTVGNVKEAVFIRKVAGFLLGLSKFTQEERGKFTKEYLADPKAAKRLGEALVLLLDRLDDFEKPQMLAKAFTALVRGKIPLEAFRRLAAAIDIGFIVDLKRLANESEEIGGLTSDFLANLLRTGLVEFAPGVGPKTRFDVGVLGRLFIGCINENYNFGIFK